MLRRRFSVEGWRDGISRMGMRVEINLGLNGKIVGLELGFGAVWPYDLKPY